GYKTVFLDGNSLNFSITNLALVTDAEFLIMNEKHLISSDKQVTRSGIELARLLSKTHQIKRRKRKNERS
ncbi:Phage protein, partial [Lacticaseibacillus paracasei subsp. paracasei Lpp37]